VLAVVINPISTSRGDAMTFRTAEKIMFALILERHNGLVMLQKPPAIDASS
jgi:hypothetical protein